MKSDRVETVYQRTFYPFELLISRLPRIWIPDRWTWTAEADAMRTLVL
jgi:hypothetical protein